MSMTAPITTRTTFGGVQLSLMSPLHFFTVFMFCTSGVLYAQTIKIKVMNGRNGHPVSNQCMNVWVGYGSSPKSTPLLETQTDAEGIIRVHLTNEDTKDNIQSRKLACGLQGLTSPIVKFGDTISIRTGYVSCQPHRPNYSWLAMKDFSTKDVLQHGIVTENTCGKTTASPQPGELIIFVRPLSWWEKLKQ